MPRVRASSGISLHYEAYGKGPPLLLLEGVQDGWVWRPNLEALSRYFRVIVLDNRGTGGSDKPPPPYSVPEMARETADVIVELGLGPVHLMGLSLGCAVAQELALSAPPLVRRLVLVGASPGGEFQFPTCLHAIRQGMQGPPAGTEVDPRRTVPLAISPEFYRTHPEAFEWMVRMEQIQETPLYARGALFMAGATWPGVVDRAASMRAPALVINGGLDLIVPVANAYWLNYLLPTSRLLIFPRAGHLCNWEFPVEFNQAVIEFLTVPG